MLFSNPGAYSALTWFFEALAIAALVVEAWAFIDAIRRPAPAFVAASKQTKPLWLIILGVATAIGLGTAASTGFAAIGILSVAAFVAAAVYLTDVRPKVREFRGGGGSSRQGPYGPW
ncbi:MAG TPA: DUF2516 family protein [Streptosporangiaceae bacterium]|nr:DUF2516 family protein [Streptosporangiaceae bacterium]